jgi:hypothetical protein|tara:strand:- start:95 stop:313 length:219 start_codon:yes stop_codon:yes gene_type:complete
MWPEHEQVTEIFIRCSSQWRCGMSGPIGLDYVAVRWICEIYNVPKADLPQLLEDLQIMEGEAVKILNNQGSK